MSKVRFATICDKCGKRSPEYGSWLQCYDCFNDVCDECDMEAARNEENGDTRCKDCGGYGQ